MVGVPLRVEEETLIKDYLMAWNVLVEKREVFMERRLNAKNEEE
ncbi:MAG: hypothetical protein Q4F83_03415 [Eubacteriales bacterium]|nr:hypothetical protein [Eubacteriales bacterium]